MLDRDKWNFELWQMKILGYIRVRKLKDTSVGNSEVDEDLKELAFVKLIQFLDKQSLSLVICDAK